MKKYPCILQHDEEDCGAASIASIAKYFGRNFTISRIRELTGTGQFGTTLLGLQIGAEALGFNTRSLKASPINIDKKLQFLPAIIHWKGNHFVVLFGKYRRKYVIADPSVGLLYLTRKELARGWKTEIILSLTPDLIKFYTQPHDNIGGLSRFLKKVFPYKKLLIEVLLINIVIGLLGLTSPLLIQFLTDDVLVRGETRMLIHTIVAVLVMRLVRNSGEYIQSLLITWFSQKIELSLMMEFGKKILKLPLTYYEQRRSGEIASRLDDISNINQLISQLVVKLPSHFFIAMTSLVLMFIYSSKMALISLVIALLMTVTTIALQPLLEHKTRKLIILESENQGIIVETFKGALSLKTSTAERDFVEELQVRFNQLANLTLETLKIAIVNNFYSDLVATTGEIILLWYGSSLVLSQQISIGQLLAYYTMHKYLTLFVNNAIELVDEFTRIKTATQRLTEVIDVDTENANDAQKSWVKINGDRDIFCEHINFNYAGRVNLFNDLSLVIPGGKATAIIGKSGCGKSTLAKLISGLYSLESKGSSYHNSGHISFGNYSLKDISLQCLREQVVLVSQDTFFWSRSIIENLRLGNPHITDEDIFNACIRTGADKFIKHLPNSYMTVLGEFGANISGGQKQRLAVTRALVKNPEILILDEATTALDSEGEHKILNNILSDRAGKTTIFITHHEQVFSKADWIIKLNNGQLEMAGETTSLLHSSSICN